MPELADNSVDLIITSPPYWQLKDYGIKEQIGYNDTYEEYVNNLNLVWSQCHRVLSAGSRLCVNIGDQFARAVYYGRYKVIPIRTEIIKFCEAMGFDYMGAIIWQKKTTSNTTGGASVMGSYPFPKNGIISIDYEFILIFKKLGTPKKPAKEIKELSKIEKEEWKEYFQGHWNFGGVKQDKHIAMFPEELPKRLIKMFSFVGDTILDPFLGSGTTSLAARNLNRNSVGYEINPDFAGLIKKKLKGKQGDIFGSSYEFIRQKEKKINYAKKINNFPYIFKDFHKFDKKIDHRKLRFGSKIENNDSNQREKYYSVKEIISPELIKLNNDIVVRLIGVKEAKEASREAIEFLKIKTKSQKVFFKYDENKYDKNRKPLVYLYLKNRTFLNAHLIKHGLASVDLSYNFKNKEKFINYFKKARL
ncbi:MAG: thermonuclease family protein [Deltaproteobacteria bacterium]|nr:thermonuclease family protein [Deltaproteobacteria bacterium]